MIKNYKLFENNQDKYIIGIPSGEIVYLSDSNIQKLLSFNMIRYDNNLKKYLFADHKYDNIINTLNSSKSTLEEFEKFFDNQMNFENYIILPDGLDVYGSIYITGENYKELPFSFKKVTGDFIIIDSNLNSLEGSPNFVGGDFNVSKNNLISLTGGPTIVKGNYICNNNYLIDLKGSPIQIYGDFDCSNNFLTDFKEGPVNILGNLYCGGNLIFNFDNSPNCKKIYK